jgi:hypothetical protein
MVVLPKRRAASDLHGAATRNIVLFTETTLKNSNPTYYGSTLHFAKLLFTQHLLPRLTPFDN